MKINNDFIKLCAGIIDSRELAQKDIDWRLMCEMAYAEKILPLFLKKYHLDIPKSILMEFGIKANKTVIKNNDIIDTFFYLQKKLDKELILGKGCSFSQYLYGDPLIRACRDIDLYVHEEDQLQICKSIEALGFREAHCICRKNMSRQSVLEFYNSFAEKGFEKEGYPYIEIKTSALLFEKDICAKALKNHVAFKDTQQIRTFDLFYSFVLLNANIYINYFSDWGIYAECKVKDLIDLCMFYYKYSSFLSSLDYEQFKAIRYNYISYTMLDIISANYALVAYFFGKLLSLIDVVPEPIRQQNTWPTLINKDHLIFSDPSDRWDWYCKTKDTNPNAFMQYDTVILPARMDYINEKDHKICTEDTICNNSCF